MALLPSPERFAAAAALYDPAPMLRLLATRPHPAPKRTGLSPETRASLLLAGAVALALLWTNSPWGDSYERVWQADLGLWSLHADLRTWIDEGLMTLFFLVVGLEAKRERDLGELREGRRLTVPVIAGLAGMAVPALVYLAVTGGGEGWGVAISTDTALALGVLTLAAGRGGDRMRVFMLTMLVVDDVAALLVISVVYPSRIDAPALAAAFALLALLLSMRAIAGRQFRARGTSHAALTPLSMLTGAALWLALFESGIDPVVSGLLIGLLTNAYEPDPKRVAPDALISPNDRLQRRLHPLTSLVVVPVFALANAGLRIDSSLLISAATSPVTWGIVLAYGVGKPLGIVIAARMASTYATLRLTGRELRGTALAAGVGFTVSLLIASRAFGGAELDQAKLGIIATALVAPVLAVAALRARAAVGTACVAQ